MNINGFIFLVIKAIYEFIFLVIEAIYKLFIKPFKLKQKLKGDEK